MNRINALRSTASLVLFGLLVVNLLCVAVAGYVNGLPVTLALTMGAPSVAIVAFLVWLMREAPVTRHLLGISLMFSIALILYEMRGNAWQVDVHMYFFAVLAMLAAFVDRNVIITSTAFVAVHHLALNFLYPAAVYPGGADFWRVVLHAVILLLEAGVVLWLTHTVASTLVAAEDALEETKAAQAANARAEEARREAEARSIEEGQRARAEIARTFEANVNAVVGDLNRLAAELSSSQEDLGNIVSRVDQQAQTVSDMSAATSRKCRRGGQRHRRSDIEGPGDFRRDHPDPRYLRAGDGGDTDGAGGRVGPA